MDDFKYLPENAHYFDSACQSLRPQSVLDALNDYYLNFNSCGERVKYTWGRKVDEKVEETREAVLDNQLIAAIHELVPVPLVLHGSSGVPDEGMVAAIQAGMTKINVSTHLNVVFTQGVRQILDENPKIVDPRKYVGPATHLVQEEVERLMRLYAQA